MGNLIRNTVKVFGNREQLFTFYEDLRGIHDNYFDFNRIIPEIKKSKSFSEDFDSEIYTHYYSFWGRDSGECDVDIIDEGDHIIYKFDTTDHAPLSVYQFLIEKYDKLSFSIDTWEPQNEWGYILESNNGEYIKVLRESIEPYPGENNLDKRLLFQTDILNDSKTVKKQTLKVKTYKKDGILHEEYEVDNGSNEGSDEGSLIDDLSDDELLSQIGEI
jgi:hypothetical protein